MKCDVFISYSSKDSKVALQVCEELEKRGISCWIAPRNINPGISFAKAIIDGIKDSSKLLLLYSENSNNSEQVLREVDRSIHFEKEVIVFKMDNEKYSDSLDYYLCKAKTIDATRGKVSQYYLELTSKLKIKKTNINIKASKSKTNEKFKEAPRKRKKNNQFLFFFYTGIFLVITMLFIYKMVIWAFWDTQNNTKTKIAKITKKVSIKTVPISINIYETAKKKILEKKIISSLTLKELAELERKINAKAGIFFKHTRNGIAQTQLSDIEQKNLGLIHYYKMEKISDNLPAQKYGEFCLKHEGIKNIRILEEFQEKLIRNYKVKARRVNQDEKTSGINRCSDNSISVSLKEYDKKQIMINIYGTHNNSFLKKINLSNKIKLKYVQIVDYDSRGIQISIPASDTSNSIDEISKFISDYSKLAFK